MALFSKHAVCKKCGHKNSQEAKFCGNCGEILQSKKSENIECPKCKNPVAVSAKFCGNCGSPIDAQTVIRSEIDAEQGVAKTWNREPGDFAKKIVLSDGNLKYSDSIIVEPGSLAIILVDGAIEGVIETGKYSMKESADSSEGGKNEGVFRKILGMFEKQKETQSPNPPVVTALLLDSGDTILEFKSPAVFTNDPLKIEVVCKINVIINEPVLFLSNVMKNLDRYSTDDVKAQLQELYSDIVPEIISQFSFDDLTSDPSKQKAFQELIGFRLHSNVQRQGYRIVSILSSRIVQEGMNEIHEIRSGMVEAQAKSEMELEQAVLDAKNVRDVEQLKLDDLKLRQPIFDEMLKTENLKAMSEITSEEELEAFKLKVDKEKVLRQVDWDSFMTELNDKEADRQDTREHALHILRRQREQEKAILDVKLEHELRSKKQEQDFEYEKTDYANRHVIDSQKQDQDHDIRKKGLKQDIEATDLELEKSDRMRDSADKNLKKDIENETLIKDHERSHHSKDRDERFKDAETDTNIGKLSDDREYEKKLREDEFRKKEWERERQGDKEDFEAFMQMQAAKNERLAQEREHQLKTKEMDVDVQKTSIAANKDVEVSKAQLEIEKRLDNKEEIKAFHEREREGLLSQKDEIRDILERSKEQSDERTDKFLNKFSDLAEKAIGGLSGANQNKEEAYKQREEEVKQQYSEKEQLLNQNVNRMENMSSQAMENMARATGAQPRQAEQPFCPKCQIHQHSKFCEKCGTQLF